MVRVKLLGLKEVISRLDRASVDIDKVITRSLRGWAEEVATDAKERTPVDTGALRDTIQANASPGGAGVTATISAGGPSRSFGVHVGYAEIVHEDLDAHHTVGEAKFLENAVNAAIPRLDKTLTADIGSQLKK